jgi:hypothetical protein
MVLDPFAGGSVRGIITAAQGHHYIGADIRKEQVSALKIAGDCQIKYQVIFAYTQVACNRKQWTELMELQSKKVNWPEPR